MKVTPLKIALALSMLGSAAMAADAKDEEIFWACNKAAAESILDMDTVAICGANYEKLKTEKFGGDSDKLLAWWREQKEKSPQKEGVGK
jgi:hypothetical protein